MSMTYAWAETGHPNCRRPDKVIDDRHESSHINHMLRILRFSRLAREQNPRGAE